MLSVQYNETISGAKHLLTGTNQSEFGNPRRKWLQIETWSLQKGEDNLRTKKNPNETESNKSVLASVRTRSATDVIIYIWYGIFLTCISDAKVLHVIFIGQYLWR